MAGPPTKPAQSIDADAGVNLSDGKYAFPDPQYGRLTYGRQEQVFAVQHQRASKNDAGLKLDFTLLAEGVSQFRCQASRAGLTLLPPENETVRRIAREIERQLPDLLICLLRFHCSTLLL